MALRKPLFIVALILILIVVLVEAGAASTAAYLDAPAVGYGIAYMAMLDGMVLYVVALMGASLLIPEGFHARVQGLVTLIASIFVLLALIAMIFAALLLLGLMLGLLVSFPFGPAVYAALGYATFPTGRATATLSLLMMFKLGFAGCLLFAHPRFLQNKTLVLLIVTALAANVIISFLHALPPRFLVSVTDVIAAIVIAILAVIWGIVFLIGAVVSVVKLVRVDQAI